MFSPIEQAIEDLQEGKMIIIVDDENRENEGDFCMAGEFATAEHINFMARFGRGLICTPISRARAEALQLQLMTQQNTEYTQCKFTISVDAKKNVSTGISAFDRAETIRQILDQDTKPLDLARPGHVFPLIAEDGGVLVRVGHTEAILDLCVLADLEPVGVICEIMNEDGTMARRDALFAIACQHGLNIYTIADLVKYRLMRHQLITREVDTRLPTAYGEFRMVYYSNIIDDKEHIALVMGDVTGDDPILVRMHSECLTGDIFSSQRCDCESQLHGALEMIAEEGRGVLVYLRQEGRGIGLKHKLEAYNLQDQGFDTVEANEKLGFAPDLRQYGVGAQILLEIGVKKLKLLTNNPKKIIGLEGYNLEVVERVPIVKLSQGNQAYLQTKKDKLGHLI